MPEAPDIIKELVDRYECNRDQYRSDRYNEEQTRAEFINPLFEALGWDVTNKAGYSPAYMDVVFEGTIRVDTSANAPDYTFRVGQTRKFFVEAKKPSVSINFNPEPANQIRRYSWSAKLPLGVLTNFHEFAIYDCRVSPKPADKVAYSRLNYLTYKDYVTRWDEIASLFSRDAVWKGAFDKYAQSESRKTGTAEVDDQFLKQIEEWRSLLAHNLALRNPNLGVRELNYAVQSTIDRIVFLRICEDRGIENECQLLAQTNGKNVHDKLLNLYYNADDKYNSGLFHFNEEKNRSEAPDRFTPGLKIDDKPLKEIISGLYPPKSPYAFSVIGADILGNVYEQFLGKVISLSSSHKAQVEEKPEVKKAGGVYYTPAYIVDYIVKNTIGKLCEGKTPKQVEKLRILDPACGSGSFLINAYAWLINWHLDWYVKDGIDKHRKEVYQATGGELRLTTKEKKRILLNNIHGVDIDSQAVEVTKLSLLLKVLEGENAETLGYSMTMFHERALPDLTNNIKCGNSLIGTDFDTAGLSDDEIRRISPFDWDKEFAEIMSKGGFDAVIGNPPYIRIQTMKEWAPLEVEHYRKAFVSAAKGNYDIYVVFVERGLSLLNKNGLLGFILPSKFLSTDYGEALREQLRRQSVVSALVDFKHEQVFKGPTTYTCLLFLSSKPVQQISYAIAVPPESIVTNNLQIRSIPSDALTNDSWLFSTDEVSTLMDMMLEKSTPVLGLPAKISRGSSTGDDDVFMLCARANGYTTRTGILVDIEPGILRTPIYATDFQRYHFNPLATEKLIFPYITTEDGYALLDESIFKKDYPKAYAYLSRHRKELESRKGYPKWYAFSAARNLDIHTNADFLVPLLAVKGTYCELPEDKKEYCLMAGGGFSISIVGTQISKKYILGLLNSKLLFWQLRSISNLFRGGWITCTKQYVGKLPIRTIDFNDLKDKALHDKIVEYVDRMLDLHKKLDAATIPGDRTQIERQIASTDREIDKLVYELYGLTEDEIKIVEGE